MFYKIFTTNSPLRPINKKKKNKSIIGIVIIYYYFSQWSYCLRTSALRYLHGIRRLPAESCLHYRVEAIDNAKHTWSLSRRKTGGFLLTSMTLAPMIIFSGGNEQFLILPEISWVRRRKTSECGKAKKGLSRLHTLATSLKRDMFFLYGLWNDYLEYCNLRYVMLQPHSWNKH